MIEMLGVLAIIAVLTVGGIAGYSKAMKKYQANKVVGEIIQVLVKLKELSENNKWYNIYRLDDETRKTLGLCLPSAENCSRYQQRTPVGDISITENVIMRDADAELCISAFNNIVTTLKGNIKWVTVSTNIKDPRAAHKEMFECERKGGDYGKCRDDYEKNSPAICMAEDENNCIPDKKYLNLYDARVVTEVYSLCNIGFNKKSRIAIKFKDGFIK